MRKMNVLLLGWEFPPVINGEVGTACYGITKALSNRVNISLILPKSDPEFILKNVDLTGLNNVNLKSIQTPSPTPEFSAFAETRTMQEDIPLYGAPTLTQAETESLPAPQQAGEQVSVGTFSEDQGYSEPDVTKISQEVEELNIFGQDFSLADYNSQVIHYARYVSRLASQKNYDIIYAYDWMTFLAGIELKLVSSKPLILHMHSLSYERGGPDAKGWVYELEKQALEKADYVIAVNDHIAEVITSEYGIAADKIKALKEVEADDTAVPAAEEISDEIFNIEVSESNNELVKEMLPIDSESDEDWEDAADKIWEVLQRIEAKESQVA